MIRYCGFILLILVFQTLHAQEESAQILKEHFNKNGQEMWNSVDDLTINGRWVGKEYQTYKIEMLIKRPGKKCIKGTYEGKRFTEATSNHTSWILAPWKKQYTPQEMNYIEEIVLNNCFSFGSPLYELRDSLEFLGLQDYEGYLYLAYEYTNEDLKRTFLLDPNDKHLYVEKFEIPEKEIIYKTYEKYRDYNGFIWPTAAQFKGKGLDREFVYDDIFIGLGIKDEEFSFPKSQ